jgi:ABC-type uncharacterized transport system permease subunit
MDLDLYGISAVLVIVGLVQLAKQIGFNSKYGGVLAVVLGLCLSLGFSYFSDVTAFKAVVTGLALGLSAAGLYSTTKNALEK